ncbi:hypothetical protein [Argonema antarcticum]|uniref:hypothetical protein n=1 Tax=Argonema antarcticum TaxID=2942763 RepID=UPI002013A2F4|nr:hypothetical protein [Argonema antarcticum]MCL1472702.1 hypothetical protein [Argonema antarcticum A004/B2]
MKIERSRILGQLRKSKVSNTLSISNLSSLVKNMNLKDTKTNLFRVIKLISVVLIASAIGLEIANIYGSITNSRMPSFLNPVFWLDRFAITAHLVEAIIAAYYAESIKQMPIKYGIYTFFVGTVGLLELIENLQAVDETETRSHS